MKAPRIWLPRLPTADEMECWRDGWNEAKAEGAIYGDGWIVHVPGVVVPFKPKRTSCRSCPIYRRAAA